MATANPAERGSTLGAIHKPQPVDLSAVIASLQTVVDADRPGAQVKVLLHVYGDVAEQLVHLKQRPNMRVNMLQKYRQRGMDALLRAEQLKGLLDKGTRPCCFGGDSRRGVKGSWNRWSDDEGKEGV